GIQARESLLESFVAIQRPAFSVDRHRALLAELRAGCIPATWARLPPHFVLVEDEIQALQHCIGRAQPARRLLVALFERGQLGGGEQGAGRAAVTRPERIERFEAL